MFAPCVYAAARPLSTTCRYAVPTAVVEHQADDQQPFQAQMLAGNGN